jgi:inner membrane protein
MDNVTHSLVGAVLGQMGLKRKSGLAMPTLIIAANIPDIDAVAVLLGGHQHLALRRGLTHGPIAMVILPLLLWAAMLWFDRWQERRGKRPEKRLPIHKGCLLALAYIGCLSHPAFDWLNSYGIRLLEPFSSQWFYGDSIFIIDVWMLLALGLGVWLSLSRERSDRTDWQRPAKASFLILCAYIFANIAISAQAESVTRSALMAGVQVDGDLISVDKGLIDANALPSAKVNRKPFVAELIVANPVPFTFWQRELLWRGQGYAGYGTYDFFEAFRAIRIGRHDAIYRLSEQELAAAKRDPDVAAFLFWTRMPIIQSQSKYSVGRLKISDQRFTNPLARERFTVEANVGR